MGLTMGHSPSPPPPPHLNKWQGLGYDVELCIKAIAAWEGGGGSIMLRSVLYYSFERLLFVAFYTLAEHFFLSFEVYLLKVTCKEHSGNKPLLYHLNLCNLYAFDLFVTVVPLISNDYFALFSALSGGVFGDDPKCMLQSGEA